MAGENMTTTEPKIAPPEVGVHEDVPFTDYMTMPGVNPSLVKCEPHTMRQIKWDLDHGTHKHTKSLDMGSAVDACVLEPDSLLRRVAIWSGARRAGGKYDEFERVNEGRILLNESEWATVLEIRDSVQAHPLASRIFNSGLLKPTLVWTDPATGTPCKGQPDYISDRLYDLKTCRNLDTRTFDRAALHFGYHIAAGAYCDGWYELTRQTLDAVLVCVCTVPPYDVAVRPLSPALLDYGRKEWRRLLAEMKACQASGHWPGQAENEEVPIELPVWLEDELDLTLDGETVEV